MPHVPEPLGSYPLILRDYTVTNPRRGELLLDYDTGTLYYCHYRTGRVISIADDIYGQLLITKVQNAHFEVSDADKEAPYYGATWPPISDRKFNTFYLVVTDRSTIVDSAADEGEETNP